MWTTTPIPAVAVTVAVASNGSEEGSYYRDRRERNMWNDPWFSYFKSSVTKEAPGARVSDAHRGMIEPKR